MRFFLFSYNSIVVRIIQFKIFEYRQNIFNQIKSNISNSLPNFLHSWRNELVNDSTLTRSDSNPFLTGRNFVIQEFVRNRKKCLQEHQT